MYKCAKGIKHMIFTSYPAAQDITHSHANDSYVCDLFIFDLLICDLFVRES